jgi:hypothetical protein
MHSKKTIAGLITVIILLFYLGSCSLDTKTVEPYLIQVDSVMAPDTVTPRTVFDIRLYGIVGPNSCYSLEKAYCYVSDTKEILIEVRGRYMYEGVACAQVVVYLDNKVETNVPSAGIYTIKVLKQDNTYLEKKLVAR